MSPRSIENIYLLSSHQKKAHRLFPLRKKTLFVFQILLSLTDCPDCRYEVDFISQAKLP